MVLHDPYKPITLGSLGGEDNLVQIEIESLRELGHDVFDARKMDQGLIRRANQLKAQSYGSNSDVINIIKKFNPDVIHTHNLNQRSGYKWMNSTDTPIVSSLHNYRIFCPSSIAWRSGSLCFECRDKSALSAIRHKCDSYVGLVNASRILLFQPNNPEINIPKKFILASEIMAKSMESLIPREKIEILRSPAIKTIPNYFQERSGWIFAGRLSQEKGIIDLINFWPQNERLDIAGDGPLKLQISDLIRELDNINLIGVYPPGDNSIFSKYEGMIFASTWLEGSPLIVADCLGAGTPVICTDQSGASEQVKLADGGVIIEGAFSIDNINKAISNIRNNLEIYSQNALNASLTIFAVKTWTEKLEKIILNL